MFPAGLFQPSASDYAKIRDVRTFAETGEFDEFEGPNRKIARLDDLVGLGGGGSVDVSGLATNTALTDGLALKADKSTTYTKTEVDTALATKQPTGSYLVAADIAGKANTADVTTALAGKQNVGDYATVTQLTDVTGEIELWAPADRNVPIDTQFAPITGSSVYATKAEVPDVSGKADQSTTYTKTEVDTALATKQPTGSYLVAADITGKADTTTVDTALALKADKSTTYTKTEVDTALSGVGGGGPTVLIANLSHTTGNIYETTVLGSHHAHKWSIVQNTTPLRRDPISTYPSDFGLFYLPPSEPSSKIVQVTAYGRFTANSRTDPRWFGIVFSPLQITAATDLSNQNAFFDNVLGLNRYNGTGSTTMAMTNANVFTQPDAYDMCTTVTATFEMQPGNYFAINANQPAGITCRMTVLVW